MFYFYAYFTIYIFSFSFPLSFQVILDNESETKVAYLITQLFFMFMFKFTLGKKLDDLLLKDINVYPVFSWIHKKTGLSHFFSWKLFLATLWENLLACQDKFYKQYPRLWKPLQNIWEIKDLCRTRVTNVFIYFIYISVLWVLKIFGCCGSERQLSLFCFLSKRYHSERGFKALRGQLAKMNMLKFFEKQCSVLSRIYVCIYIYIHIYIYIYICEPLSTMSSMLFLFPNVYWVL